MSKLRGERCLLRIYRTSDAEALATLAGDFAVARWMTARFPHPYTLDDARAWIAHTLTASPIDNYAIDVDGELAGGAGITPHTDERLGSAEFGYWLGRAFWGRGIATEAAQVLAAHAFADRALRRLEAHVFVANRASARVLEKCGFIREAVLREAYVERDGAVSDGLLYARLRSESSRPSG